MTDIAERMSRARARLLLDHYFFGMLALKLEVVQQTAGCPTIQTDGTHLEYNPEWCAQWSDAQLEGLWAHEVMHCAMGHPWRRHDREGQTWNVACDVAINQQIRSSGIALPPTELESMEQEYAGWFAEQIYAKLKQDQKEQGTPAPKPDFGNDVQDAPQDSGSGQPENTDDEQGQDSPSDDAQQGQGDDGTPGQGEGQGAPEQGESAPGDGPLTEFDWQVEVEVAMMAARRAGNMPGGVERLIHEDRTPKVDWKTLLRRFVEQTIPYDTSWQRPNRRYVSQGMYLPGVYNENTPRLDVIVDTSGSTQGLLADFGTEMVEVIREVRPSAVRFIYCDTRVTNVQEFTADDDDIAVSQLEFRGGGGTVLQPAFDWSAEQDEPPAAIICLTDLYIGQVKEAEVPVLWMVPEWTQTDYPWGETVRMEGVR